MTGILSCASVTQGPRESSSSMLPMMFAGTDPVDQLEFALERLGGLGEVRTLLYAAVVGVVIARFWPRAFRGIEALLTRLARRPAHALLLVFTLSLALRLPPLLYNGPPMPVAHDENSYLLGADTLAHFRLTNPTPPAWIFFETEHVNMVPTYQSMYPPGQSFFLGLAQLLTGTPFLGVWLSIGLMCAAITWMLQAFLPPRWALLGGLFTLTVFDSDNYFAN